MLAPKTFNISTIAELAGEVDDFSQQITSPKKAEKLKRKVERSNFGELLNIDVLKKIRSVFIDKSEGENESLCAEDFIDALSAFLPRSDIEKLYKKIDVNDDGFVDWQEFTGFLTTSDAGGTTVGHQSQRFLLKREQDIESSNHKDMIEFMTLVLKPFPIIVTCCKDNQIHLWNYSDLKLLAVIRHVDKNAVFLEGVLGSMTSEHKALGSKIRRKTKDTNAVTAIAALPLSSHIAVASADCAITVYDIATQEVTGRLTTLSEVPTSIECFASISKTNEVLAQYICFGNAKGQVTSIELDGEFGLSQDGGAKKRNQVLFEKAVSTESRIFSKQLHKDWITDMKYVADIDKLVVASMDCSVTLYSASDRNVSRTFTGHKSGVRFVAWSVSGKYICSAGCDRTLIMWDPYTLHVMSRIDGIPSFIVALAINDFAHQVITVLRDKSIRTWDSITYEMLVPVADTCPYYPRDEVTAALFVPPLKTLITAGNRVALWSVERCSDDLIASDDDDLCTALYNSEFFVTVIVTNNGHVSVHNVDDGSLACKFSIAPNSEFHSMKHKKKYDAITGLELPFINSALFDKSQRRLIVITNSNIIQVWNFHNGTMLKEVTPRVSPFVYPSLLRNGVNEGVVYNITAATYESVYISSQRSYKKMLLFGTNVNIISSLLEETELEDEPLFNLHKPEFEHEGSVVWMQPLYENNYLVCYNNGIITQWDLERAVRVHDLKPSGTGLSFVAMRRKANNKTSAGTSREMRQTQLRSPLTATSPATTADVPLAPLDSPISARVSSVTPHPPLEKLPTSASAAVTGSRKMSLSYTQKLQQQATSNGEEGARSVRFSQVLASSDHPTTDENSKNIGSRKPEPALSAGPEASLPVIGGSKRNSQRLVRAGSLPLKSRVLEDAPPTTWFSQEAR